MRREGGLEGIDFIFLDHDVMGNNFSSSLAVSQLYV